ncbi:MAG TPA: hypothetical protein VFF48_04880 [Brevundimonas sp.]|nr:hypothetical protein [Brevundimonas sp.]
MTILRPTVLLVLAALVGCAEPERAPERPATPAPSPAAGPAEAEPVVPARPGDPPPARSAATVGSLAGSWRIAGIDGAPLDEPVGLALTGDERQLWWEPRCAGAARDYSIEGSRISFASTQGPRPAGAPTPPVCAIGLPPRLGDVMRALDGATSISRTPSNGVLIAGPRHSLTLYSQ